MIKRVGGWRNKCCIIGSGSNGGGRGVGFFMIKKGVGRVDGGWDVGSEREVRRCGCDFGGGCCGFGCG